MCYILINNFTNTPISLPKLENLGRPIQQGADWKMDVAMADSMMD